MDLSKITNNYQITVTIVSWFSFSLLWRLLNNLSTKAACPEKLQYYIIDNTNGKDPDIGKLKQYSQQVHIEANDTGNLKGSWAHAHGLNFGTNRVQTPYTVVMDPDIHIFKENWDEFLKGELKKHQAAAIGAPYPSWKLGKYHQFPSPPFIFYETSVLKTIGLDWTPFPKGLFIRSYNFMARQIVRLGLLCTRRRLSGNPMLQKLAKRLEHVFGVCAPDTGYLIASNSQKAKLKTLLFNEVQIGKSSLNPTSLSSCLETLATEYELYRYENESIMTHKYSTNGYLWRTSFGRDSQYWMDLIRQVEAEMNDPTQLR